MVGSKKRSYIVVKEKYTKKVHLWEEYWSMRAIENTFVLDRNISLITKFGLGSITSNFRFCHTYQQVIEYRDSITCRPRIIGYYRKPTTNLWWSHMQSMRNLIFLGKMSPESQSRWDWIGYWTLIKGSHPTRMLDIANNWRECSSAYPHPPPGEGWGGRRRKI